MADNKSKVKEDRRRVALEQQHEREYLMKELFDAAEYLRAATDALLAASYPLERIRVRLRSGFPAATKASKRRGK